MTTLRAITVSALIFGSLLSCSKKVDSTFLTLSSNGFVSRTATQAHFPRDGQDSVDLKPDIIIFGESNKMFDLSQAYITVTSAAGRVDGKVVITGSDIRFTPSKELTPRTVYNVNVILILNRPDDNRRKVNSITSNNTPFASEAAQSVFSFKFTTRRKNSYAMSKTSHWVTNSYRDGNKLMQMGDYLYSYGGWRVEMESLNDVFRGGGDLTQWERIEDAPWQGRHTYGIGKIGSTLYIYGGDHFHDYFDVWKSNDGEHFTPVLTSAESVLGPRILYGACVHNSRLFVLGGQSGLGLDSGLNDVWSSSDGRFWKRIANNLPFLGKNISGSTVSFNNKIWVIGGGYYKHPDYNLRYTKDIYSSYDGITWQREPDVPWNARQFTDLCVWNNRLWMIGGYNEENLADIWYMDEDEQWHQFEAPPEFEPRHASGVGVYNDKLVIVAGNYHNDCWVIEKK